MGKKKATQSFETYVHISNGGISFQVEVTDLDNKYGGSQWLTTEVTNFGIPLTTKLLIDDNTLVALEYIVKQARRQRKAFPELKHKHIFTSTPSHLDKEEGVSGETCTDSASS